MSRHRAGVRQRASVLALAAALALPAAACSQPRLERIGRDLARAVPKDGDATLQGTMTIRVTNVAVKGLQQGAGATVRGPQLPKLPIAAVRFLSRPGQQRTAIVGPSGTVGVVGARVMFARRKQNGPADTRPWVRLDLERLADIDVPDLDALLKELNPGVLAVITPQFALDLLHGVLTGSIEQRKISGGRVITFNTSIDKANRELRRSDDQRDDRKRLLRAAAITGDIFGGTAQLDENGAIRHLTLRLRETPDKRTKVELAVDLDLTQPVKGASLATPGREHTIRVSTLSALRGNLLDQLVPKNQPSLSLPVAGLSS